MQREQDLLEGMRRVRSQSEDVLRICDRHLSARIGFKEWFRILWPIAVAVVAAAVIIHIAALLGQL